MNIQNLNFNETKEYNFWYDYYTKSYKEFILAMDINPIDAMINSYNNRVNSFELWTDSDELDAFIIQTKALADAIVYLKKVGL